MVNRPLVNILTSLGPVLCGGVLVGAFSLKLRDSFFYFKLEHSALFAVALVLDLVVGAMLIVERTQRARLLGTLTFFVYGVYRLASGSESCDCFGRLSTMVHQYAALLVVCVCFTVCLYAYMNGTESSNSISFKTTSKRLLSFVSGLVAFLLVLKSFFGSELIVGRVLEVSHVDQGRVMGLIELHNVSTTPLRLLGCSGSKCSGTVLVESPVEVKPNSSVKLPCELSGRRGTLFLEGESSVVVAVTDVSERVQFSWIALN